MSTPERSEGRKSSRGSVVFDAGSSSGELLIPRRKIVAKRGSEYPEWVGLAEYKVAEIYKNLFAPRRSISTVFNDLCRDRYAKEGRTVSIIALTDPGTGGEEFAGYMRFTVGKEKKKSKQLSPIEAMDEMSPPEGWDKWLRDRNIPPERIGELGRLVFATADPRKIKEDVATLKVMRKLGFDIARRKGITHVFAIMPSGIAGMFKKGGYEPTEIEGAILNDTPQVQKLVRNYPGYWIDRKPKLYCLPVPKK